MAGIGQYLKETRAELNHVAWPTRTQTIVYTILIAFISVGLALYLGLFDFLFNNALAYMVNAAANMTSVPAVTTQPAASTSPITITPVTATSTK